ncbi:hypothetical protein E2C01_055432 [Portunus trituberculatus]|uniref:Endonuclease/exonuclease/phosphatase domain-containing protein n=1 Tax=Portunus trituberculatus TaxID=210409 RepID=A0A5B7GR61_PORTR|nr:hypothetical protein [Portunus trituberculatus]
MLKLYPFAEISIFGDFNVHHQLWLSSLFTEHPCELDFNFAILHDLSPPFDSPDLNLIYEDSQTSVNLLSDRQCGFRQSRSA